MVGVMDIGSLSAHWAPGLVDMLAKGAAVLTIAGPIALCLRRSSAALRHLIGSLALTCLLMLPVLSLALPAWQVAVLPRTVRVTRSTPEGRPPAQHSLLAPFLEQRDTPAAEPLPPRAAAAKLAPSLDETGTLQPAPTRPLQPRWSAFALLFWLAGALLAALPLLVGIVHVRRLIRRATPLGPGSWAAAQSSLPTPMQFVPRVRLLVSADVAVPMTWGCLRPVVILPAESTDWPDERRRVVLLHELAHVKRWDCLTQTLGWLACALHWVNPLAWFTLHRLRVEREAACDDQVLAAGLRPSTYADHLLELVRGLGASGTAGVAAVAMARSSSLEVRLRAVLDAVRVRRMLRGRDLAAGLTLATVIVLPLAAIRATRAAPAPIRTEDAPSTREAILKRIPAAGALGMRATTPKLAQQQAAREASGAGGIVIARIERGLTEDSGLKKGDHVITFDGVPVESRTHWQALVRSTAPGTPVEVEYRRRRETLVTLVTIDDAMRDAERPIAVTGRVVAEDGKEPPRVIVYPTFCRKDSGGWSYPGPCLTDDQGCFAAWLDLENTVGPAGVDLLAITSDGRFGCASVPVSPLPPEGAVELKLQPGVPVSGRLVTGDGEGIPDILIKPWEVVIPGARPKYRFWWDRQARREKYYLSRYEVRTDTDGRFILPALPRGSAVALEFFVPGYAKPHRGPYPIAKLREPFVFGKGGVPQAATAEGVLVAADTGSPITSMGLLFAVEGTKFFRQAWTGKDGRFRATHLQPGIVTCAMLGGHSVSPSGYALLPTKIELEPGEHLRGLRFEARRCVVLKGKVTDPETGAGVAGCRISCVDPKWPYYYFATKTKADGSYRMLVAPSKTVIHATGPARGDPQRTYPVELKPGEEVTSDFLVHSGHDGNDILVPVQKPGEQEAPAGGVDAR